MWHSQLAPWVETTEWTPKTLTKAIKTHVRKVASHWRGRCYAWDVVNEALNEDGTYRESVFYKVLGEEYIKIAFREAAKADPHAKLYYNDYNLESPSAKSEGAIRIVKMLQDDGIKVDGIGMQAHLVAHRAPSLDDQIAVMKSYAKTGVEVALTELDVRIELPVNKTNMAWQKEAYGNVSPQSLFSCLILTVVLRRSMPVLKSKHVSESQSGISMTPLAGCRTFLMERVRLCSGLKTSAVIQHTMEHWMP